jgi:hypothetical protein
MKLLNFLKEYQDTKLKDERLEKEYFLSFDKKPCISYGDVVLPLEDAKTFKFYKYLPWKYIKNNLIPTKIKLSKEERLKLKLQRAEMVIDFFSSLHKTISSFRDKLTKEEIKEIFKKCLK